MDLVKGNPLLGAILVALLPVKFRGSHVNRHRWFTAYTAILSDLTSQNAEQERLRTPTIEGAMAARSCMCSVLHRKGLHLPSTTNAIFRVTFQIIPTIYVSRIRNYRNDGYGSAWYSLCWYSARQCRPGAILVNRFSLVASSHLWWMLRAS